MNAENRTPVSGHPDRGLLTDSAILARVPQVIIKGGTFGVYLQDTGSEVPTSVVMKSSVSWDIMPSSPLKVN
jgi:hypothetical protein